MQNFRTHKSLKIHLEIKEEKKKDSPIDRADRQTDRQSGVLGEQMALIDKKRQSKKTD